MAIFNGGLRMERIFLGMTLGGDPHTVGIYRAARIAKMLGVQTQVVPPDTALEKKIEIIKQVCPTFLGLSYRLSAEQAIGELTKFLQALEQGASFIFEKSSICFAALPETLAAVHQLGFDAKYNLNLQMQSKDIYETTIGTIKFFGGENHSEAQKILDVFREEASPERIELLDEIAKEVVRGDLYLDEQPLKRPSDKALLHFPTRMAESDIPMIRTHFGIPDDSIAPTVEGIIRIASAGAVDEISLGSSDLSQRFFGDANAFYGVKNDGGVPYKTKSDLEELFSASRIGNFPSVKPYCHVKDIIPFIDTCLEVGMLRGAHQAVPLFWFSELDGRGPMSVDKAIDEHIGAVKYLVKQGIPTEMNDPNQWSSRLAHDAVFVADYGLIASVMYAALSQHMIFQCQFNKPVETGDYADLAKFYAAREIIRKLKPTATQHNIYLETRAGIEHFSVDQDYAKYQLARTTLLQMLLSPSIIHLVSYCEADHAATADDVIESSKLLRRAVRLFRENHEDIRRAAQHPFVEERKNHLIKEASCILEHIARESKYFTEQKIQISSDIIPCLSDPCALKSAMNKRIMTAPGIMSEKYRNGDIITHAGKFGAIDSYNNWETAFAQSEEERLLSHNGQFNLR